MLSSIEWTPGAMGAGCADSQTHAALLGVESTSRSVSRAAFLSASVPRLSASFFQALISMEQLSAQGGSTTACRGYDHCVRQRYNS